MTYKYYVNYGSGDVEVHPVGDDNLKIIVKEYSGQMFKRRVLDGDFVLQNDPSNGYTDYTIVSELAKDLEVTLKIKRSCDAYAATWWQGYFCGYDGEYDEDQCSIKLKVEADDDYRPFLENWDSVFNLLDQTGVSSVDIVEEVFPEIETLILWGAGDCNAETAGGETRTAAVREVEGAQWTFDDFVDCPTDPSEIWRRAKLDYQPNTDWVQEGSFWYLATNNPYYSFDVHYPNSRVLKDFITSVVDEIGGLTYSSAFFDNATNPVTGIASTINNILMGQKSDFIGIVSDPATIGNITFGELMDMLKEAFQVYMYISGGVFYLEHVDFFDGGLTYGGTPSVVLDLTTAANLKYIVETDKYSYDRGEMYRVESWEFMEANNIDFKGLDIIYDQVASNARSEDSKFVHSLSLFTTDFSFIQTNPGEIAAAGFLLLTCEATAIETPFYTATETAIMWLVIGSTGPYTTIAQNTVNDPTKEYTVQVSGTANVINGFRSAQVSVIQNSVIRLTYTLTIHSGVAPLVRLINGVYYGYSLSNEYRLLAGSNVLDIRVTRSELGVLNFYNPQAETADFTIVFKMEIVTAAPKTGVGILSGETVKNEPLSLARLQDSYWKSHRPLTPGIMNGTSQAFTTKNILLQDSFFTIECGAGCGSFDYYGLVKTLKGNGRINSAEYNLRDGTLDLELSWA